MRREARTETAVAGKGQSTKALEHGTLAAGLVADDDKLGNGYVITDAAGEELINLFELAWVGHVGSKLVEGSVMLTVPTWIGVGFPGP